MAYRARSFSVRTSQVPTVYWSQQWNTATLFDWAPSPQGPQPYLSLWMICLFWNTERDLKHLSFPALLSKDQWCQWETHNTMQCNTIHALFALFLSFPPTVSPANSSNLSPVTYLDGFFLFGKIYVFSEHEKEKVFAHLRFCILIVCLSIVNKSCLDHTCN